MPVPNAPCLRIGTMPRLLAFLGCLVLGAPSAPPVSAAAPAAEECRPRDGLPRVLAKLAAGQTVRIAYLGGSITEAENGWRTLSREWLAQEFPAATIEEIRATISGTGADFGATRLQAHVLRHAPDLVFVEFAVNGAGNSATRGRRTVEGLVRQLRSAESAPDILFVYTIAEFMLPGLRAGRPPATVATLEEVAAHYGVPSVDFAPAVLAELAANRLLIQGPAPRADDGRAVFSPDGVHPFPETGHRLYLEALRRALPALRAAAPAPGTPALPAPLDPDNWETAALVALDDPRLALSAGWEKTAPPGDTARTQRILDYLPGVWRTARPGATLEFSFYGTAFGLSGFRGPDAGQFRVTVDDEAPVTGTFFDRYVHAGRISHRTWFYPRDLPSGPHRVRIQFLAEPPDRRAILGDTAGPQGDAAPPALHVGALLLVGDLPPAP